MSQTARPGNRREVVSFVRRSDRLTPAQQKAWDAHHDAWVVEVPRGGGRLTIAADHRIEPRALFGRTAPLIVEIGPGMGDSLAPMAAARPEADVLAFEVYQPAVARILAKLAARQVSNVRVLQADATDGLRQLPDEFRIDELWMFFPDPWPKTKHHKRRLLTTEFADLVAARLRPGGRWRLATDWADYAEQMRRVLDAHPAFTGEPIAAEGDAEPKGQTRWAGRPMTKFERRGIEAGHEIVDLCYRRR